MPNKLNIDTNLKPPFKDYTVSNVNTVSITEIRVFFLNVILKIREEGPFLFKFLIVLFPSYSFSFASHGRA